ncbi:MAG: hypothetical protein HOP91_03280 [Sphingomonas sp.]|nr:hypothetical protein [Sphingomonas sp.]
MLAYAANRPVVGKAPSSPTAMLLIISAHVALIAAIMSARMEFQPKAATPPPLIKIPIKPPPPPNATANPPQHPRTLPISDPTQVIPLPHPDPVPLDPPANNGVLIGGSEVSNVPSFPTQLIPVPVRHEARLLTPPDELKPPYPQSKIVNEEEATLQLRLTISDSGRVTAVDPVGGADRVFLEAARRYLIAHWRYRPATEDGHAISSSVVISLSFRLDG